MALLAVALLTTAGCTFNIYVFPGVKTDVRWPVTQPAEYEPDRPEQCDGEEQTMPQTFAKFRHTERPATLYRVNLDDPDARP